MIIRRFMLIAVFGFMTMALVSPRLASAGQSAVKAEEFITSLADQAIKALTTSEISREERETRFRTMLNENFAINTIARWVLGRHWKKATQEQQDEYLKLFEKLLVVTYVDRFKQYSGENLKVVKSLANSANDAMVFSQIVREGTQPVNVDWRVRASDNETYKIIDVMVEGVSMGQTQRSEFASVIRQNGGEVEGLLAVLRKRVG